MLREDTGDLSPTTAFQSLSVSSTTPPPPAPHNTTTTALDDIFGEDPLPAYHPTTTTMSSHLDDIFGCSPPSHDPLISSTTATSTSPPLTGEPPSSRPRDVSDIPRLRSIHVTAGYRDGIAESKAQHVQDGFDEGFPLGAVVGLRAGWALGVLEGVAGALRAGVVRAAGAGAGAGVGKSKVVVGGKSRGAAAVPVADAAVDSPRLEEVRRAKERFEGARKRLEEARKELDMTSLFGQEYFDEEGIWRFHVEGREGDVTFEDVAAQHPLIKKWASVADEIAKEEKIDLRILERRPGNREDEDEEGKIEG